MISAAAAWLIFGVVVLGLLIYDLVVAHRRPRALSLRESLLWAAIWIGLAVLFNLCIYFWHGPEKALQFLSGYLVEESLSVDNLFVFILIFRFFKVPPAYQHKVLFWGILGAMLMRALFILAGVSLIHRFHWIIYLFGAFLVYTGLRLAANPQREVHPEKNPLLGLFRRCMRVSPDYDADRFSTRQNGRVVATPLLVVLLVIESTDVVFALDSIPAILAITTDPFIVYTSNIFAVLGLRALFFVLAGFMEKFHLLHYGLAAILSFIGVKMLLSERVAVPTGWALAVIAVILVLSIAASLIWKPARPGRIKKNAED